MALEVSVAGSRVIDIAAGGGGFPVWTGAGLGIGPPGGRLSLVISNTGVNLLSLHVTQGLDPAGGRQAQNSLLGVVTIAGVSARTIQLGLESWQSAQLILSSLLGTTATVDWALDGTQLAPGSVLVDGVQRGAAAVALPDTQVAFGTGTGLASSPGLTYDPVGNRLSTTGDYLGFGGITITSTVADITAGRDVLGRTFNPAGSTVALLPVGPKDGSYAYATNGRKAGEGPGVGTGVPVWSFGGAWLIFGANTAVTA